MLMEMRERNGCNSFYILREFEIGIFIYFSF